jgi:hypothetical protein
MSTIAKPHRISAFLARPLWILLTTVLIAAAYVAASIWIPYSRELRIVRRIEAMGGEVETNVCLPEWIQERVGWYRLQQYEVFDRVTAVDLHLVDVSDSDLAILSDLSNLECLMLGRRNAWDVRWDRIAGPTPGDPAEFEGRKRITDEGLAQLMSLRKLHVLSLDGTAVTDDGMLTLAAHPRLGRIALDDTCIADAGLLALASLPRLEKLTICDTRATNAGLAQLVRSKQLEWLDSRGTQITSEGYRAFSKERRRLRLPMTSALGRLPSEKELSEMASGDAKSSLE